MLSLGLDEYAIRCSFIIILTALEQGLTGAEPPAQRTLRWYGTGYSPYDVLYHSITLSLPLLVVSSRPSLSLSLSGVKRRQVQLEKCISFRMTVLRQDVNGKYEYYLTSLSIYLPPYPSLFLSPLLSTVGGAGVVIKSTNRYRLNLICN